MTETPRPPASERALRRSYVLLADQLLVRLHHTLGEAELRGGLLFGACLTCGAGVMLDPVSRDISGAALDCECAEAWCE